MSIFASSHSPSTSRMLSVLRIVTGSIFMLHGAQKMFGFPNNPMNAPFVLMSQMGLAGVLELFGGALIVLGLLTRPVAFVLAGEMAAAYFMAHFPKSFYPVVNGGEPTVLYCFIFLYLVFAGAGVWSLDAVIAKSSSNK